MQDGSCADRKLSEDVAAFVSFWKTVLNGAWIDGGAVALLGVEEVVVGQEPLTDFVIKLEAFLQARDGNTCGDFLPEGAGLFIFQEVAVEQEAFAIDETAPLDGLANPIRCGPISCAYDSYSGVATDRAVVQGGIDQVDE